jgi:hypothetical protein
MSEDKPLEWKDVLESAEDGLIGAWPGSMSSKTPIKFPMGIGPKKMAKGERVKLYTLLVHAEKYRCQQFVIPSLYGRFFQIHGITMGGRQQLMNGEPIPASVFDETYEAHFEFDAITRGQTIEVDVECLDTIRMVKYEGELSPEGKWPAALRLKRFRRRPTFQAICMGFAE